MKLKDIRKNLEPTLDVGNQGEKKELELEGDPSQSFKDINTDKSNINLQGENKIVLTQTGEQSIDSLEKKGFFSKDISLEKKDEREDYKKLTAKKLGAISSSFQSMTQRLKKGIKSFSADRGNTKQNNTHTLSVREQRIGNLYFLCFLLFSVFLGAFLYKDVMEKYLTYSYETLSYVKNDFPDYVKINENIAEAKNGFLITKYLFKPISFLPNRSIDDAEKLIIGGEYLTKSFEKISRIGFDAYLLVQEKEISEILFSHFLDNSRQSFFDAMSDMKQAYSYYDNIDRLGEDDLDEKLSLLKETISGLIENGTYLEDNYEVLLNILGHSQRKKYMLVFQNSDEIRPQGGFMGSVAFIEVFGGQIQKFEKKDIYALEWEVNKDPLREPAPEGLDKITGTFGLRDANYFIGTEASSLRIKELLARADIEVDGIIYANINLANDILDALGGFDSEVLGTTVDGNNFPLIMSSLVESKLTREATLDSPKDILFEFIDELVLELKDTKDYKVYAQVFLEAFESRDLFMYAFNSQASDFLHTVKADGAIDYKKTLDFNYPVFTSISGNKSDRYVERSYNKYVNTIDNCTFNTRLNIKVRHNFGLAEERDAIDVFSQYDIDVEENLFIQGLGPNKQFVRIVVPKEASINNKNVVIKEYENIQVVEFYMETPRFDSTYFVLSYALENPDCEEYSYVFYKQPGIPNYNFDFILGNENLKFTGIRQDFEYKLD